MSQGADQLSNGIRDLLAAATRACDQLTTFLQSPEARRRLPPATRYRLYAAAINCTLQAARIAVDAQVRLQKLAPAEAWEELMALITEVNTSSLIALRDRITPRHGWTGRDQTSSFAGAVFGRGPSGSVDEKRPEGGGVADRSAEERPDVSGGRKS
jgi:hypothetical protein